MFFGQMLSPSLRDRVEERTSLTNPLASAVGNATSAAVSTELPMIPAIKQFIERAIAERDATNDATEAPSDFWTYGASMISFVRQLDAKELRHIRRHAFYFTGDNYQSYLYGNKADRDHLLGQIEQLFAKLPGFRIDETDIGIGYDTPRGRLSRDI